ncbi:telomerase Cajal body protein 1 homolog isoform 1-T1 [Cochliomyia hominivorax]
MNLNDSSFNSSIRSDFTESVLDETASLDKNVNFSKLDLSQILSEESTLQNTTDKTFLEDSIPKLSITLQQQAKDILRKYCGKENNSSLMDLTQTANGSMQTSTETLKEVSKVPITNSQDTANKRTTMEVSNVVDDEDGEEESVIPVDEVEDDDVEEVSTLESSAIETPQKDMFSHLQPNKTVAAENRKILEKSNTEKTTSESMLVEEEQGNSQFLQDEDKLFGHPFVELGRRLWPSTAEKQFYTKGCLWSPDGTCLLVPVHLDGMHIVELPTDLYTMQEINKNRDLSDLTSAVHVKEGGTVYDCCWYPFMNSSDPATCCWLATRQHEPIHMWDAFSGELRCSYRGYDDVDEVESAISIIFSNDAQKIIGGYKKTIKIFDTNIPGRDSNTIPVKKAISCFALTTDNDNCVTAGTWAGYINHYDLRAPKLGPLFVLGGHSGGITWLKYSPTLDHNWYLFSGARKDNKILQWDMRNYTKPLQVFERNVQTNQRIYYDLTPLNTWLASGDTEGLLRIWHLSDNHKKYQLPLHQDCCNGVSFHPSLPIITTSSGQYHFVDLTEDCESQPQEKIINYENSLLFLWFGPSKENDN